MTHMPGPADPAPRSTRATAAPTTTFRPELQGLRALAVVLVVVYHVWFGRVSGGVDVFFVISGFLITGGLYRSALRGTLRFRPMWARQAVRLVPAAFTVLLACVVAGFLLLPEARWLQTIRELAASAVFGENWRLAADSVDYAASTNGQSIVQHFWSLSIQVQFYLVWPLVVAVVALAAQQAGATERLRGYLILTMGGLFVASLTFSVALTLTNQPLAYFHSLTRVWEFALGGLLALTIDGIRLSPWMRVWLGWLGVVALVACGAVLRVDHVFPGFAALWPTLAACAVLTAGTSGSAVGADRVLGARPLRYLGDLSYALYLWHWPLLVLWLAALGREAVGVGDGLLIIGGALALAVLTHHLVEEPLRKARLSDRARLRSVGAMLAVVLAATGAWQIALSLRAEHTAVVGDEDHPGAMAMSPGFTYSGADDTQLLPPLVTAPEDWSRIEQWTCAPMTHYPAFQSCVSPLPNPDVPPEKRLVVAGDSHAQQFTAALLPVATTRNWQIITMLHGACPFSTVSEVDPNNVDCVDWNAATVDEIADLRPDAVFALSTRDVRAGLTEQTPPGFAEQWRKLDALGIPVVAARDNPRFDSSPADCLQQHGRGARECGVARAAVYGPPPYENRPGIPPNVHFLDFSDYFCDAEHCPAEIGNVLVYMDFNHVSATFMSSLAPVMEERLTHALGW